LKFAGAPQTPNKKIKKFPDYSLDDYTRLVRAIKAGTLKASVKDVNSEGSAYQVS
jgi:hypothetical protein